MILLAVVVAILAIYGIYFVIAGDLYLIAVLVGKIAEYIEERKVIHDGRK